MDEVGALLLKEIQDDEDELWLLMQRRILQLRFRSYVTSAGLLKPQGSPWCKLYDHGDDYHFINMTSLDRNSFHKLLDVFKRYYDFSWKSKKVGRPGSLKTKHEVLGLVLMFYTATIECKSLCGHFGIPPTTLSRTLRKAETALLLTLKSIPEALIKWPSLELQRFWSVLVSRKEPLLKKKFGFIDGKNYRVQKPSDSEMQNAHFFRRCWNIFKIYSNINFFR